MFASVVESLEKGLLVGKVSLFTKGYTQHFFDISAKINKAVLLIANKV